MQLSHPTHLSNYLAIIALAFFSCGKSDDNQVTPPTAPLNTISSVGEGHTFSPSATFAQMSASSAVRVTAGNTTFFIGYQQVSSTNQNCIIAKYTNGQQVWVRADYETTGDDSRGYGLLWDGAQTLYAAFSCTGTQGTSNQDFRRFCTNGWHTSYGQGGGAKAAVILKIDPITGDPVAGTYFMSRLSNGNANTIVIEEMELQNSGDLLLTTKAWYSPLKQNKMPYNCTGTSPFDYKLTLTGNLETAVSTEVIGCK